MQKRKREEKGFNLVRSAFNSENNKLSQSILHKHFTMPPPPTLDTYLNECVNVPVVMEFSYNIEREGEGE